jgi:hypothetical protein
MPLRKKSGIFLIPLLVAWIIAYFLHNPHIYPQALIEFSITGNALEQGKSVDARYL